MGDAKEISFAAERVEAEPGQWYGSTRMRVTVKVHLDDFLSELDAADILKVFDASLLLDAIGRDEVCAYFGLAEPND